MNFIWAFYIAVVNFIPLLTGMPQAPRNTSSALACKCNRDCPEREVCRIICGNSTCQCSSGHERNSQGQCIERCDTKLCRYKEEQCFAYEDVRRCLCPFNYKWNNEHQGCEDMNKYERDPHTNLYLKMCKGDDDCDIHREICDISSTNKVCRCKGGFIWDSQAHRCRKTTELFKQGRRASRTMDNVCITHDCHRTANEILNIMDSSVHPCDDFYRFSCGGFVKKNFSTLLNVLAFDAEIDHTTQKQVRSVIEEPTLGDEPRFIKLIKTFYKSCMNEVAIEQRGLEPLREKLRDLGSWPVVEGQTWNETQFDWIESIHKARIAGLPFDYFVGFDIMKDFKNSTKKILYLTDPSLGMLREYLVEGMNSTQVKAYYEFMVEVAVMLGAPRNKTIKELKESLEFEIKLAIITPPEEKIRSINSVYNKMTIAELSQKYPSIPWKNYITNILTPHVTVDDSETIIVMFPDFISNFMKLMDATPKRVQANYMMWRIAKDSAQYLQKNMIEILSIYEIKVEGYTTNGRARYAKCVSETKKSLVSVNALYVRKYDNAATRKYVTEMVAFIRSKVHNILQTVDWMDDITRKNALDKAAAMVSHVSHPEELLNDTIMEEAYENLDLADDYFENSLRIKRFNLNEEHSEFRKPVNKNHWKFHAEVSDANALYKNLENSMSILAGNLQTELFHDSLPKYMNYGSLGSIIGHEISHAFDDWGRQFDQYGNLNNWWTPYASKEYDRRAQCFIDQYSNYTVKGIGRKLNGFKTRNENIADNSGYKIAYLAYKEWSKRHGEEQALPRLTEYNTLQMFWIRAAIAMCSKIRPNVLKNLLVEDEHSPGEFRIFGSFRNLPEFAADFKCPVGSKMNPENKCSLW